MRCKFVFNILRREGISYCMLYDDPKSGLMCERRRGRPTNAEKEEAERIKLNTDDNIDNEISALRTSLGFSSGSKLVLLLSIASDDMIRLMQMFPEVFFMDVTGCVNRQHRDFFLLAVKDSSGKTFTANITSMPSGKSWVFLTIYKHVLPFLYGKTTIRRNRLALTDEDIAEYQTFETCISSDKNYSNTTLGLCSFHALWKPYKESVKCQLPKVNATTINEIGKKYG